MLRGEVKEERERVTMPCSSNVAELTFGGGCSCHYRLQPLANLANEIAAGRLTGFKLSVRVERIHKIFRFSQGSNFNNLSDSKATTIQSHTERSHSNFHVMLIAAHSLPAVA